MPDLGLIPLFTTQFTSNLELLLQQKGSKLRPYVSTGGHTGKMASPINQIAPVQAKQPEGRFAPLSPVGTSYVRRWVFPTQYDLPQMVDSFDELQTIVDPKSAIAEGATNAMGRSMDDTLLNAVFATNYVGQDAASLTQEVFDTTKYQIADNFKAAAATGLTVAKIIEIKRLFRKNHVDLDSDPITLVIGSQQESDLLNQQQVVSKEYNDTPVLKDGKVERFLGCNIVVMERVPETTAGATRGVLAFVKSGLYLGMWQDMTSNVTQRTDLSGQPWQIYSKAMFGATRTQPGKVLRVLCADTTGADITP
jgi:hypothetical protein